jgi:hypothetical protein
MCNQSTECMIFKGMFTFILFILSLIMLTQYSYNNDLVGEKCNIVNVIYPTRLPINHSDFIGFTTCDCGKNCKSDLGICISVYGNIINKKNIMMFRNSYSERYNDCTVGEKICRDGENMNDRLNAINSAKTGAQEYIKMINKTIDCYYNDDEQKIYFSNDFKIVEFCIIISMSMISLLIISYDIFKFFQEENIKNIKSDYVSDYVNEI